MRFSGVTTTQQAIQGCEEEAGGEVPAAAGLGGPERGDTSEFAEGDGVTEGEETGKIEIERERDEEDENELDEEEDEEETRGEARGEDKRKILKEEAEAERPEGVDKEEEEEREEEEVVEEDAEAEDAGGEDAEDDEGAETESRDCDRDCKEASLRKAEEICMSPLALFMGLAKPSPHATLRPKTHFPTRACKEISNVTASSRLFRRMKAELQFVRK